MDKYKSTAIDFQKANIKRKKKLVIVKQKNIDKYIQIAGTKIEICGAYKTSSNITSTSDLNIAQVLDIKPKITKQYCNKKLTALSIDTGEVTSTTVGNQLAAQDSYSPIFDHILSPSHHNRCSNTDNDIIKGLKQEDDNEGNEFVQNVLTQEALCKKRNLKTSTSEKVAQKLGHIIILKNMDNKINNIKNKILKSSNPNPKLCEADLMHGMFNCELCSEEFQDQLKFFLHLKSHYEPGILNMNVPSSNNCMYNIDPNTQNEGGNVHCIQCNTSFKNRTAYDIHVTEVHIKVELNEFSDHEDIMDGIEVGQFKGRCWVDDT